MAALRVEAGSQHRIGKLGLPGLSGPTWSRRIWRPGRELAARHGTALPPRAWLGVCSSRLNTRLDGACVRSSAWRVHPRLGLEFASQVFHGSHRRLRASLSALFTAGPGIRRFTTVSATATSPPIRQRRLVSVGWLSWSMRHGSALGSGRLHPALGQVLLRHQPTALDQEDVGVITADPRHLASRASADVDAVGSPQIRHAPREDLLARACQHSQVDDRVPALGIQSLADDLAEEVATPRLLLILHFELQEPARLQALEKLRVAPATAVGIVPRSWSVVVPLTAAPVTVPGTVSSAASACAVRGTGSRAWVSTPDPSVCCSPCLSPLGPSRPPMQPCSLHGHGESTGDAANLLATETLDVSAWLPCLECLMREGAHQSLI